MPQQVKLYLYLKWKNPKELLKDIWISKKLKEKFTIGYTIIMSLKNLNKSYKDKKLKSYKSLRIFNKILKDPILQFRVQNIIKSILATSRFKVVQDSNNF